MSRHAFAKIVSIVLSAAGAIAACGGPPAPVVGVAEIPASALDAGTDASDAGEEAGQSYSTNAKTEYAAAKALVKAGKLTEARAAFLEVKRRYGYSRYARDSELRVVQIDFDLGDAAGGHAGLRQWFHDHRSDTRLQDIYERLLDLDCKSGIQGACGELSHLKIGQGTCASDTDCTSVTEVPCCSCCNGLPKAASRAWLAQAAADCKKDECGECFMTCGPSTPNASARVECVHNTCAMKMD